MKETWNIIKTNIQDPDSKYYLKYCANKGDKIILQTGPIAITIGFLKGATKNDLAVDYKSLLYINFDHSLSSHTPETNSDIGALGYDTWGGTWYIPSDSFIYYDENDRGITYNEWKAINGI